MARLAVVLVLLLSLVGCSSGDGGGEKPVGTPSGIAFVAAPPPAGAAVALRAKSLTDTELVLEIVSTGVSDLYGVAFRLSYDPAVLALASFSAGTMWGSPPPLALASQKTPGLLVGVVTEQGKAAGLATDGGVLATVTLSLLQKAESPVAFVPGHSAVVGENGKVQPAVAFAGGALVKQ